MDKVTIKERYPNGLTIIEVEDDEGRVHTKNFQGFRVGICWPMAGNINPSGFFCIIGQGAKKILSGQFPLMVIKESTASNFSALIEIIFNEMGILGATEIFIDANQRFRPFIEEIDFIRQSQRPNQEIILNPAPFSSSFIHGVQLINKWMVQIKGLTFLKNSAIRSELRGLKTSEVTEEAKERFGGINALRYVLGAYEVSNIQRARTYVMGKELPAEAWT